MKDNKRVKLLLKVIKRIYDQNPEMQKVIDGLTIKVCADKGVSPEPVFFYFDFLAVFFMMSY